MEDREDSEEEEESATGFVSFPSHLPSPFLPSLLVLVVRSRPR